jgi:hypothetical protein
VSESGDADDDSMSIHSAVEITVGKSHIMEYADQW